jgi:hypothetical protein
MTNEQERALMNESNASCLSIYLMGHGTYAGTMEMLRYAEKLPKPVLAKRIAEANAGFYQENKSDTAKYWMQFPKTVLVFVYSDLYQQTEG